MTLRVHNVYAPELKVQLQRFKIQFKEDFNPCNGDILQNPRYKEYSKEQRGQQALIHHTDQIEHAIQHIRPNKPEDLYMAKVQNLDKCSHD